MCGIAGIVDLQNQTDGVVRTLAEMSRRLKHRGPDDEGFVFFSADGSAVAGSSDTQASAWNAPYPYAPVQRIENCNQQYHLALAHRRLSVIDLSEAGHQPMCNADGSIWIVCNGEIYNYIELRQELEAQGEVFKTRSDIEVLLRAYERWGMRFLDRLNGMWALVIYDSKKKLLFGSRDRFGVKPLYYYHKDIFAFASEQKAILAIPGVDTAIVPEAVYEHLLLGQVELREEGFYKNIKELLPGHCFELDLETGRLGTRKYYRLSYFQGDEPYSADKEKEYIAGVRERIFNAVSLRLRSDVPLGFCLSGGLDSSSIVCVSDQIRKQVPAASIGNVLHTYTATNDSRATDESQWADIVSKHAQTQAVLAACRAEDILPGLDDMVYHQDVPLYSTSTFAQNRVMKAARENGSVILLDGQGGDELFAGYQTFYTSMLLDNIKHLKAGAFTKEFSHLGNSPTTAGIFFRSLMKLWMEESLPARQKNRLAARYKPELAYFRKNVRQQYAGSLHLSGEFSSLSLNELLNQYFTGYYLKNLLRWEDRCSMQYSIESRTPFSDDIELVEYVFSIPAVYKIRQGWSKHLLREAMKDILPEEIRTRKDKLGFATPQQNWLQQLQQPIRSKIQELLPLDTLGMVDHENLLKNWDLIFSKPSLWKVQDMAWRYLNYLIWIKTFWTK
jgi:asparagine synthase (glutamine-hydrolysing)